MLGDVRSEFPFFMANPGLIYADSAATSQKPYVVLDEVQRHLATEAANAGRGSYPLAAAVTSRIEETRHVVGRFINADPDDIAFTSGATASLNAVVQLWAGNALSEGDQILLSRSDHSANVAPWVAFADERKCEVVEYGLTDSGEADIEDIVKVATTQTKVVVLTHIHNVFGDRTQVARVRERLGRDVVIVLDAAQGIGHVPVDVQALGVDFIAFSSHKMFGITGTGVLWASPRVQRSMKPVAYGGTVREKSGLASLLEVGTLHTSGIVGLGAAIRFIESIGIDQIEFRLSMLTRMLVAELESIQGIELLPGVVNSRGCACGFGIASLRIPHLSAADVGFILSESQIAVRTGGHCTLDDELTGESVRISLHIYNNEDEVDALAKALQRLST